MDDARINRTNGGVIHTVDSVGLMSGYKKFAVVGAGAIGSYIVQQLLEEVIVLTSTARRVRIPTFPAMGTKRRA
jgi:hypothetical protein